MIMVRANNELRGHMMDFMKKKAMEFKEKAQAYKDWDIEAELVCSSLASSFDYMGCDFCRFGYVQEPTWKMFLYARNRYCKTFPRRDRQKQPVENPYSKGMMALFYASYNRLDAMQEKED